MRSTRRRNWLKARWGFFGFTGFVLTSISIVSEVHAHGRSVLFGIAIAIFFAEFSVGCVGLVFAIQDSHEQNRFRRQEGEGRKR